MFVTGSWAIQKWTSCPHPVCERLYRVIVVVLCHTGFWRNLQRSEKLKTLSSQISVCNSISMINITHSFQVCEFVRRSVCHRDTRCGVDRSRKCFPFLSKKKSPTPGHLYRVKSISIYTEGIGHHALLQCGYAVNSTLPSDRPTFFV